MEEISHEPRLSRARIASLVALVMLVGAGLFVGYQQTKPRTPDIEGLGRAYMAEADTDQSDQFGYLAIAQQLCSERSKGDFDIMMAVTESSPSWSVQPPPRAAVDTIYRLAVKHLCPWRKHELGTKVP